MKTSEIIIELNKIKDLLESFNKDRLKNEIETIDFLIERIDKIID